MNRLTDAFEATLKAVEAGKEEIFNIYETTRNEVQRLRKELAFLVTELTETIKKVDEQQSNEKKLRHLLMEVNRDFDRFNERQMLDIYSQAKDAQGELQLLHVKEMQLRSRRDEIERSLKNLEGTVKRAENLMEQVGLALRLLKDGITEISQLYSNSNDQKKELAFRIIKVQEEERRRVAREVHDGPAQSLANIILRLEIAEKLLIIDHEKVKDELKELNVLVRENLKEIRRVIFDLRPIQLINMNIVENIKNYILNYDKTYGIKCRLTVEGAEKNLSPSVEAAFFRILQEGMTNVAKHANSAECSILIQFLDEWIIGKIVDHGRGFDEKEALEKPGEHFGLIGIKERIEMFLGKFSIKSVPGEGTVFEFRLPYSK